MHHREEKSFSNNKWTPQKMILFAVTFFVWCHTNALSVTHVKELMNDSDVTLLPRDLIVICLMQNLISAIFACSAAVVCIFLKINFFGRRGKSPDLEVITVAHSLGNVAMNWLILFAGGSMTLLLKLAEPLSTLLLSYLMIGKVASPINAFSVAVVVCGVALIFLGKASSSPSEASPDDPPSILYSFVLLVGVSSYPIRNILSKESEATGIFLFACLSAGSAVIFSLLSITMCVLQITDISDYKQLLFDPKVILIGVYFAMYNLSSYVLLAMVDAVTHSVLGIVKRVYSIIVSVLYLNDLSLLNKEGFIGAVMCLSGLSGYAYLKTSSPPALLAFPWSSVWRQLSVVWSSRVVFAVAIVAIVWSGHPEDSATSSAIIAKSQNYVGFALHSHRNCGRDYLHITCDVLLRLDESRAFDMPMVDTLAESHVCADLLRQHRPGEVQVVFGNISMSVCVQHATEVTAILNRFTLKSIYYSSSKTLPELSKALGLHVIREVPRKDVLVMVGYTSHTPNRSFVHNLQSVLRLASSNSGNRVWAYGAFDMLHPHTNRIISLSLQDTSGQLASLRLPNFDGPDLVVLASANLFMDANSKFQPMMTGIMNQCIAFLHSFNANVPAILLGVGLQYDFQQSKYIAPERMLQNFTTTSKQSEFLQAIVSRSRNGVPNIAVRGKLTSEVCRKAGVGTCLPLGCPSFMISSEANHGEAVQSHWENLWERLQNGVTGDDLHVVLTLPATTVKGLQEIHIALINRYRCTFVLQTGADEANVKRLALLDEVKRPFEVIYFYEVSEWIQALQSADVVFSARIHGTMTAVAAGVPFLLVATDYRILEMAEAMAIPFTTPEVVLEWSKATDPLRKVISAAMEFDGVSWDRLRWQSAWQYERMLTSVGVECKPAVEVMAGMHLIKASPD